MDDSDLNRFFIISVLLKIVRITEKSTFTFFHSDRVASTSYLIGKELGLPKRELGVLWRASLLHDIGKLGIPTDIIMKKGKLSDDEFNKVKEHCQIGYDILKTVPYFITERLAVLYHHERYDGNGYPVGLLGKQINLFSRIISVADVFDSLVMDRPYRRKYSFDKAKEIIFSLNDKAFDPEIVDIFKHLYHNKKIIKKYREWDER